MKVLLLGDDGRAHALAWKLFNSPLVDELVCAPGNGGTAPLVPAAALELADAAAIARWAFDEGQGTTASAVGRGTFPLAFVGSPKWVAGKYGTAIQFDGAGAWLRVGRDPALTGIVNNFTIAFWAKPRKAFATTPPQSAAKPDCSELLYFFLRSSAGSPSSSPVRTSAASASSTRASAC